MRFSASAIKLFLLYFSVIGGWSITLFLNISLLFQSNESGLNLPFITFVFTFSLLYLVFVSILCTLLLKNYLLNRDFTKRLQEFDFVDTLDSQGIGVIFFSSKNRILRVTSTVERIFEGEAVLGQHISLLLPSPFNKKVVDQVSIIEAIEELSRVQNQKLWGELGVSDSKKVNYFEGALNSYDSFILERNNSFYEVRIFWNKYVILLKDVTAYRSILQRYQAERSVIGEAHIDNIQNYEDFFSEEDFFQIQVVLNNILETLVEEHNFIYKNYSNGRFWMLLDEDTLNIWKKKRFSFFQNIYIEKLAIKLTISVGFGVGIQEFFELNNNARRGLEEAQLRGGNQVCIISSETDKTERFGSESEIESVNSRVRVNLFADKLFEQLSNPNIANVIIYGHIYSDLDALASTYTLYLLATEVFGKKAYIQNQTFDATAQSFIDQNPKEFKRQRIFIKPKRAQELTWSNSLVIVCDINDVDRLENPSALENVLAENVFIIDHHRIPNINRLKNFDNIYVESTTSSTSEIIVEMLALKSVKNIPTIAYQMLLSGIYVDTNRFQSASSFRTFTAVAYLRKRGALLENTIEFLKLSEQTESVITKLLENLIEVKSGYFLAYSDTEASIDTISMAADRVLEIKGRLASFVIGKLPKSDTYKLSARGLKVNVQLICEVVGGGGHFGRAAATVPKKDLKDFVENLKHAIVSTK